MKFSATFFTFARRGVLQYAPTTGPKGWKDIARGEAPGKCNNIASPEGVAENDALHTMDTCFFL